MAFNLTLIDTNSRVVYEYERVPNDAIEAVHTLLTKCCHGNYISSSIEEYKDRIIIHPWRMDYTKFPYSVPNANIYLDGKLEDMNKYDLCGIEHFPNLQSSPDGYECDVLFSDNIIKARLFLWKESNTGMWKGLVVAEDDKETLKYAKEKCRLKLSVI